LIITKIIDFKELKKSVSGKNMLIGIIIFLILLLAGLMYVVVS